MLFVSDVDIIKKWANIRDAFVRAERNIRKLKLSGVSASNIKKYVYADQLQFLLRPIGYQPTEDSMKTVENNKNDETRADFKDLVAADEVPEQEANISACQERTLTFTSRKKRKIDPVAKRMLAILEKEELPKISPNRHSSFFDSIMPSIENFSDDEVLHFQAGILQLIMDIKDRRRTQIQLNSSQYSYTSSLQETTNRPFRMRSNHPRAKSVDSLRHHRSECFPTPTSSVNNMSDHTKSSVVTPISIVSDLANADIITEPSSYQTQN